MAGQDKSPDFSMLSEFSVGTGAGRRPGLERVAALSTEFEGRRILESTMGAAAGKGRGAIAAKFHAVGILKSAFRAGLHATNLFGFPATTNRCQNRVVCEVLWKPLQIALTEGQAGTLRKHSVLY